jgi:hypothetical protein
MDLKMVVKSDSMERCFDIGITRSDVTNRNENVIRLHNYMLREPEMDNESYSEWDVSELIKCVITVNVECTTFNVGVQKMNESINFTYPLLN